MFLLWIGILGVLLAWILYANLTPLGADDSWGIFGDKFGALNTLFTGWAFVGLLATLWHERASALSRASEHAELIRETREQVREARRNFRLTALSMRIEALIVEIAELRDEIAELERADAHDDYVIDPRALEGLHKRTEMLTDELRTHRGTLADVAFNRNALDA